MSTRLILTAEHAGNRLPAAYQHLFLGRRVLDSHRAWDPGSLDLARAFLRRWPAPLFYTTVTRLLVEPNRSVHHRRLFSEFTAPLDGETKQQILQRYYYPHRNRVENWIAARVAQADAVVHLSFHTFTPKLDGRTRNADVGLLYDPARGAEKELCRAWHSALLELRPELRVRRNYPYLGKADGFTTHLRRRFPPRSYVGIELEVNQLWPATAPDVWRQLKRDLAVSFPR